MSYNSPSDDLDKMEIYDYLALDLPITEIIRKAWKDGFEWGKELGYEEAEDEFDSMSTDEILDKKSYNMMMRE